MAAPLLVTAAMAQPDPPPEAPGATVPRVSLAGEMTATIGPDDHGYFNYTDYDQSTLRLFTAALVGGLRFGDQVSVLGEIRLENDDLRAGSGLYLRWVPWLDRSVTVQAGRIPPVFGRFSRRGYGQDNPLIGTPLPYQYLTTLRAQAVPVGANALLAVRGRGWRVTYPQAIGEDNRGPGLPLVSATRWDTGVQAYARSQTLSAAVAVTVGSPSRPRVEDDNDGKQVAGRLTWQPSPGLGVGLSLARGAFLSDGVTDRLPAGTPEARFVQEAVGIDAEVSSGHWLLCGEAILSQWTLPELGTPAIAAPLRSLGLVVEGRYRIRPALHAAARGEYLTFSSLDGGTSGASKPWEAPVTRVEVGVGYKIGRHALAKVAWQHDWRRAVPRPQPSASLVAAQVALWF